MEDNSKIDLLIQNKTPEEIVEILKKNGFTQIETVKYLRTKLDLSLSIVNDLVQNAECWKSFKAGNDYIRDAFFSGSEDDDNGTGT